MADRPSPRYGDAVDSSPLLFGISLYQQKHIELLPKGRTAFNAQALFSRVGDINPASPYLSQIPCSWGAVYFPEHWREFHDYLAIRLSQQLMNIDSIIVPGVRSNGWAKSWKRYFIELVYLRGYVMLYPNFSNYSSLSTNHLELGSHVSVWSKQKHDLFSVPLMPAEPGSNPLLNIPNARLPPRKYLPILNLTGALATEQSLVRIGRERRRHLMHYCQTPAYMHDAKTLFCI
jgi:hypothetical protein